ncbi:MAG: hypothetical protein Q9208_000217 [Pyrenodesmia sp. 3 TL-2023]
MSVKTLKQAIENLPSTLNQLYDDAFRRIDDQNADDRDFANKALRWVAYTYRPLTVPELEEALAIEPQGRDFDSDAAPDIASVLEACAGLLIVDKETEQVRLVHYTAQDYLDTLLTSRYREAHASIAGDCITYLNYDVFQIWQPDNEAEDGPDGDSDAESEYKSEYKSDDENDDELDDELDDETEQRTYYLLAYTSEYWVKHYSMAGQENELDAQLRNFLASNPRIRLPRRYRGEARFELPLSPLYLEKTDGIGIAACCGLLDPLRDLLQQSYVNVNGKSHEGPSALHLAAMNDEVASVRVLLEYGADIECKEPSEGTPLMCAITNHSTETAWLLVERGAHIGNKTFDAVRWASPIPFLQLLLNHGADIDSGRYRQLKWRVSCGDVETVRWFLRKGAPVDIKSRRNGRTLLLDAVASGSVDTIELLLRHGADFSIRDRLGHTILHAACGAGKVAMLKRFLELGTDIEATNSEGSTPIQMAIQMGRSGCVELLLENKADADKRDQVGHTPLMAAIARGLTKIIHLLVDAGAKVDLQDGVGATALHYAVCMRDISTIRLLLKHHANCEARSSLDLSLTHDPEFYFPRYGPTHCDADGVPTLLSAQRLHRWEQVSPLQDILDQRDMIYECRVWKGGMTALDIACVLNDAACIELLEPLTGSRTESFTTSFDDYMCELFGFSSVPEFEKKIERREKEENEEYWQRSKVEEAKRRRKREKLNRRSVERGESEEASSLSFASDTDG